MKSVVKRLLIAVLAVSVLASCGRAPDLVGVDNAQRPVALEKAVTKRKVFISTTRQASEVVEVFYTRERSPDLGFASVVVSIPPNHVPGNLERPKRLPPNPDTEFAVVEPTVYGSDSIFVSRINRELATLPRKDRKVMLFVHGYNNTISDSILRMAQFANDTGFSGVLVLFSWASAAKATQYVYDLNSALAARPRFIETAKMLAKTNAVGFDIFAHSMGSMLTVESIMRAELEGGFNRNGRVDNVMLASPDIDLDLFKTQLEGISSKNRNFVVFVSQDDKALGFARRISGGVEKVGAADAGKLEELGLTVIDLTEIDDSTSGTHSKFAGSPEVVQLIGKGLKADHYKESANQPTLVEVLDGVPVLRVLTP